MDIIEQFVKKLIEHQCREFIIEILKYYFTPSFGAIKQREFEIYLFQILKDYGFFASEEPSIFEVISKLQVTRGKAKSLIYESNLRFGKDKLDERVKEELKRAKFLKLDGSMIGLDIEDPLLIDYLKDKLKKLGHPTDGSYSNQILKITADAYVSLLDEYIENDVKNEVVDELIKDNLIQERSFKGVVKLVMKGLISKAIGTASDQLIEEYISPLFDKSSNFVSTVVELVKNTKKVKNETSS
jgi:hypothetical protein